MSQQENQKPLRQVVQEREHEVEHVGGIITMPLDLWLDYYNMAMSNPIYMVEEFHRVYGLHVFSNSQPDYHQTHPFAKFRHNMDYNDLADLRVNLLKEELEEYMNADMEANAAEMVDALCDIIYVAVGAALELGLPIRLGLLEVQRSNMSKLDADGQPIVREDGKILKGPDYTPPNWIEVFEEWAKEGGRV